MRFLLVFPLVFLLILGSFVSIDAAPQSVFKPVPPWSTHKRRLKRSIDDSSSTTDYDSLSLDQLTKLLVETKEKAEKEKMDLEAANSLLIAKQDEVVNATEDYDKKKEEWDKFKDFNEWTKESVEAQKIIESINIRALEETYLDLENDFLEAETNWKNAKEDLEDIENPANVEQRLTDDSTRLAQEIATQSDTVRSLEGIKTEKNDALSNLKKKESINNGMYDIGKCNAPEKASGSQCVEIISNLDQIKRDMTNVQEAAEIATQKHKEADVAKKALVSQKKRVADRLSKLGRAKGNIKKAKEDAAVIVQNSKAVKDDKEKPYLEAKAAFQTAETTLAEAKETKINAEQKLTNKYQSDAATKESEANTAQDEAGKEKTRLEGELVGLKADKDEKEKIWNATSTKVAEMQRAETAKKSAVSTGGSNLIAIIIPIVVVVVVIIGVIGAAVFMFLKKRKRLAKQAKVSHDSGDAAPAAPAAPPEAPEAPAPGVDSQKPPIDAAAAAPQPGSAKSNETPLAIDAPPVVKAIGAPPVVNAIGAPPVVKAIGAPPALKAIEAAPVVTDDENKWTVLPYLRCLDKYCEKFEDFVQGVSDKEHRAELQAVANPGTMVFKLADSYVFNTEDESGNNYVSVGKKYLKFIQDGRRSQQCNAISSDTKIEHKYTKRNPDGCLKHAYYAPNNMIVPFVFESARKTREMQIADKKALKGRQQHWRKIQHEAGMHPLVNKPKKNGQRAGAGHDDDDASEAMTKKEFFEALEKLSEEMTEKEFFEALEKLSEEEQEQFMIDVFLQELTDNVSTYRRVSRGPPSLFSHYRHEFLFAFNKLLDALRCKRGDYGDDYYSFRFAIQELHIAEDDSSCEELEPAEQTYNVSEPDDEDDSSCEELEPAEQTYNVSEPDDETSTDRSSAGGGEDSRDKKKKKKKRKKGKKKSSDKHSDRSESSRREKKVGKHEKDSIEDDEFSGDDKKKKIKRTKKSEKKSEPSRPEKKDGNQKENDKGSSSSTESDPRSPPRDFLKKVWRSRRDQKKAPLMLHGQQLLLWDLDYIPELGRLTNREAMSDEQLDQVLRGIEENSKNKNQTNPDTDKIMDLLCTYYKTFKDGDKAIEYRERKKSVSIGDIHGSFDTIENTFKEWGGVGSKQFMKMRFIFTGDYVDRGSKSLEVIMYVLALAVRYPDNVVVLRGNHEIYATNTVYGFYLECLDRIKDKEGTPKGQEGRDIHFYFNYVFGYMPIVCLHNNALHSHGGMTRTKFANMQELNEIMPKWMWDPMFCNQTAHDFLWSDPMEGISGFLWDEGRGAYVYGPDVVRQFVEDHPEVKLIVRGHQCMFNGWEFFAGGLLVCIFSCAGYDLTVCNNHGAVMVIEENYDIYFIEFVGVKLADRALYKGPVHKALMVKTVEEHNMNNMYPNLKAAYVKVAEPIADAPSETVRL